MNNSDRDFVLQMWRDMRATASKTATYYFDEGNVEKAVVWLEKVIEADENIERLEAESK